MFIHLLIFGDSIALGAWDVEGGGWVDRLKKYLYSDKYRIKIDSGSGLLVYSTYNLGIGGLTTSYLVESFENEIKERVSKDPKRSKEDIVIFAIGINDCQYKHSKENVKVKPDNFRKNLEKLLNKAHKYTKKVLFVGISKVDESKVAPMFWAKEIYYTNNNIKEYNKIIRGFCQKNKLLFIDVFDLLNKDDLKDGVHPNSQGHQKIFKKVKDFLLDNNLVKR